MQRSPLPRLALLLLAPIALAGAGLGCSEPPRHAASEVPVRVDHVGIDDNQLPVVFLEERDGPRWLPIWIGSAEARSIAMQIEERRSARPNSHDLTRRVIRGLRGEVERVLINDLRGGTYFATLTLTSEDGTVEIDARPSDAIAIALRSDAPIYVLARLFTQVGRETHEPANEPAREPARDPSSI